VDALFETDRDDPDAVSECSTIDHASLLRRPAMKRTVRGDDSRPSETTASTRKT
jgi:hypothetical protein